MINSNNLINDGLTPECRNNGQVTWSYNQGVILGGLLELHKATGDNNYIVEARKIVDAVLASPDLNRNGIFYEFGCEGGGNDCGGDAPTFKGVFMRNLGELDRFLAGRPYKGWLEAQAKANWDNNRNSLNQFGVHWAGPFDRATAGNQQSAFEAFIAAV
jgi:predicted alpha-1,6-mannanase (GH76 family)